MSDPERCGQCRFWERSAYDIQYNGEGGLAGKGDSHCRRHAPAAYERPNYGTYLWPVTRSGDWCGDFERHTPIEDKALPNPTEHRLDDFELPTRCWSVCKNQGIDTLEQLATWDWRDLQALPNCGPVTIDDLTEALANAGLMWRFGAPKRYVVRQPDAPTTP
jgi:hypothetical protein